MIKSTLFFKNKPQYLFSACILKGRIKIVKISIIIKQQQLTNQHNSQIAATTNLCFSLFIVSDNKGSGQNKPIEDSTL